MNKELVILKISGASLKGKNDIIDLDFLREIGRQIKVLSNNYKVAIVLGGGNIWRGNIAKEIGMQRYKADQMGMLATVMNSLALQSLLTNINVKSRIFSTIEMEKIADSYIIRNLEESLNNNEIAILSCGTGRPYFTTDTGVAVSAAELGASYIMMGKNNVDGVYDSDPNKNPNAKFYKHLTYSKAIELGLEVMDITAATICKQSNIKTIVFKMNEKNGILNAFENKSKFTLVSENEKDLEAFKFGIKNIKNNSEKSSNNWDNKVIDIKTIKEENSLNIDDIFENSIEELQKLKEDDIQKNQKKLNEIIKSFYQDNKE